MRPPSERLAIGWSSCDEASITVGDRALAVLSQTTDRDAAVCGRWLWGVDDDGQADDRNVGSQLVDENPDVEREHLEHAALEQIASGRPAARRPRD